MNTISHEDCKIHFFQDGQDDYVSYRQKDNEIWRVRVSDIRVISYYSGMNGDNDTEIVVLIDSLGKKYSINLFVGISNFVAVHKWLDENFGYKVQKLPVDETPRVCFPVELFGIKAFDNSIGTWLIQNFINSGNGKISKRIKEYLRNIS